MKARLALLALSLSWTSFCAAAPHDSRDFYTSFADNIRKTETGFLDSAHQVCATEGCGIQQSDAWLLNSQLRALSRAAEKTFDEIYAIRSWSRKMLQAPSDLEGAGVAAIVGGAVLYVDGLHAKTKLAGWKLGMDLASGRRLRSDAAARLANVEISREGQPLALTAGWGRQAPVYGLRYALRY